MKKIKEILYLITILLLIGGCDKGFVEINTDPYALNKVDPALLFAGAQRITLGSGWESESTVAQQFVNPYNDGATLAFNFNANIDNFQNTNWNGYTGSIKNFVQILSLLDGTTTQINLQSITRIWKAKAFMDMVDHYSDVPYFRAGLALNGAKDFYPVYDNDADIYDDLYKEITESLSALDPNGDFVSSDLFYGSNGHSTTKTSTATAQVAKWNKLGNSLLLRLGMRYTRSNPTKAASIAAEAFSGGVMTSNADNAFVVYDGTLFTNLANANLINNNPRFYYVAEPFVNQLKTTLDPRSRYMVAAFADPNNPLGDTNPDYNVANQFGLPVGITALQLANPPYRGPKKTGFNYSQCNVNCAASVAAPTFWMTYAQTSLLLADAAKRGWIPGGDVAAQQYYEAGITANMDQFAIIISASKSTLPVVSAAEKTTYITQAGVAYDATNALSQINTQYWITNYFDGSEAWANIRRTGFPVLNRNTFDNSLLQNGGDGFVHRFSYPDAESAKNKVNYQAAVATIGGIDDLVSRVFWDTK